MDSRWQPYVWDDAYRGGMVESYFLRLNSPDDDWAAWIKYTYLRPRGAAPPVGECWFIFFDPAATGSDRIRAWKENFEVTPPAINNGRISMGPNSLLPGSSCGALAGEVRWDLDLKGLERSSALLAAPFYSASVPTTKLTTPIPVGTATGRIEVGNRVLELSAVPLALGHNWGHRHTPSYVWAQANGEGPAGKLFFEGAGIPAPLQNGGGKPKLTVGKVRFNDQEIEFNLPHSLLANSSRVEFGRWSLELRNLRWRLSGEFHWDDALVAGLCYEQPDGDALSCLNSMCASATMKLLRNRLFGGTDLVAELSVEGRAALELVTADAGHGVGMLV